MNASVPKKFVHDCRSRWLKKRQELHGPRREQPNKVPVFSLWCDRRQEAFATLGLLLLICSQVCVLLWLFIAFSSFKLLLLSLKSTKQKLPKTSKAFLFKAQHKCDVTLYREWRKFDFHARWPKHSLSSETAKQIIHVVKKKRKKTGFNKEHSEAINHPSAILARQVLTSGIKRVAVLFSVA